MVVRSTSVGCRQGTARARSAALLWVLAGAVLLMAAPGSARSQDAGAHPDLSRPLSLDQLMRMAQERNLGLAQSYQSVESAKGSRTSSYANVLPEVSANWGYGQSVTKFSSGLRDFGDGLVVEVPGGRSVTDRYSLSVSAGQSIIAPSSWFNFRRSAVNLEAARLGFDRAEDNLAYEVTGRYFSLVRAQELSRVAQEAFQLSQDQLHRAQSLFDLGSVARSDVLQAQVNLASNERERIAADNSVEVERARLCLLLAIPVNSPLEVEDPPPLPEEAAAQEDADLVGLALENRSDFHQAHRELQAARLSEKSAKWSRYPTLSGGISYSRQLPGWVSSDSVAAIDIFKNLETDATWGFSLGLRATIFDGLSTKGSIQQAVAGRRSSEQALEEKRLSVALEVREANLEIKNASEGIRSARVGVGLAEESVRLQKALYEGGGGTLLEWNNAQVELTRARVALVEAEVNLRLARAGLENALGRSVD